MTVSTAPFQLDSSSCFNEDRCSSSMFIHHNYSGHRPYEVIKLTIFNISALQACSLASRNKSRFTSHTLMQASSGVVLHCGGNSEDLAVQKTECFHLKVQKRELYNLICLWYQYLAGR